MFPCEARHVLPAHQAASNDTNQGGVLDLGHTAARTYKGSSIIQTAAVTAAVHERDRALLTNIQPFPPCLLAHRTVQAMCASPGEQSTA
jgi:hypothetical protein